MSEFDIVGVGLNATDTLLIVPHFPAYAGKVPFEEEHLSPGGQVASALVACARLGLRTKYIGAVGDDLRGRIQVDSLKGTGINLDHVMVRRGCPNQSAYIVIDRSTGERTVLWRRDDCLKVHPEEITEDMISGARILHIDGHDTPAVARAAEIARRHGIPVTVDVDTIYQGFDRVLPNVDYLVSSSEFPAAWTGETDPFKALETIQKQYGMRVAAMTLGAHGALARENGKFYYAPAFVVNCVDTTGAGDVFHGAFCYAVLQAMPMQQALDFSNAMAALNCTALGARGGIRGLDDVASLMGRAERRSHPDYVLRAARGALHEEMFPLRDTQPSYSKPVVTVVLIAINVLVFLYQVSLEPYSRNEFIATYGLVPDHFSFQSVLTSMFLHGGWMHVLGNMWFLWIFGDNIEDILGHAKYLLFYLLCGFAAAMAQFLADPTSRIPMVGASGAIAGVMGAYLVKFPHSRILSLVTIIFFFTTVEVPAWLMLIWWFFIQFFNGVGSIGLTHASQGGGVAFLAHVGGFLTGIALIYLLVPRQRYTRRQDLYW